MSKQLIQQYYTKTDQIIQYGGSSKETSIRRAFANLLSQYAENQSLMMIDELTIKGTNGKDIRPDGTLKNVLRLDMGYWESKDTKDDLEEEINKKIAKGYPQTNILYEDSQNAILIQNGVRVGKAKMREPEDLHVILTTFINYKSEVVDDFNKAIEQFKTDVPVILKSLRAKIDKAALENQAFIQAKSIFLDLCRSEINPDISDEDIREMLIQHILTENIFSIIFHDAEFHRENNIAKSIEDVLGTFFNRTERKNTLEGIRHYYETIERNAANIADHHEKQRFLKVVYENFYKAYNPKGADRLGIVYTPGEIVHFMIESTDYLLEKHFGRSLADKNVEILDPATGTGTFICDLIDYLPPQNLAHKFKNEIFANEIAILPYYIANLNIEYTFKQKMKYYEEFQNLCFVDTLDNTGALAFAGKQTDMFGLTSENAERIKRQNNRKISVIIGNPPYNAKQANYNFQNANRTYKEIDKRIKDTYIKKGTAQNQNVIYDMYVRFFRWASDRINKNGIVSFVTNSSFIDGLSFDGFRKCAGEDFTDIYIINMRGNARTSGELRRREGGNVFSDEIRVGVAIYFFIKDEKKEGCRVHYHEAEDYEKAFSKKAFLKENTLKSIPFIKCNPDGKGNWINQTDNDFDSLIPLMDKDVKGGKSEEAIFKLFSNGVKSQRDEWIYDFSKENLSQKMQYFIDIYSKTLQNPSFIDKMTIKWDADLESYLNRKIKKNFEEKKILKTLYRPFTSLNFYFDKHFNGRTYQWFNIFRADEKNVTININSFGMDKPFATIVSDTIVDVQNLPNGQCLPLYRYTSTGEREENITDWALALFRGRYGRNAASVGTSEALERLDIFHYVYAVLHDPTYRMKYEQNLKRDFPRIPFYDDFWKWAEAGKQLVDLHLYYETAAKYPLQREDKTLKINKVEEPILFYAAKEPEPMYGIKAKLKVKLKADKENGTIELDEMTMLTGVPSEAWTYKLGNRSALEWILDQYKEKKPSDPTIAERFDTYRFADYKEQVIDLLKRVTTVSVETMRILEKLKTVNEEHF